MTQVFLHPSDRRKRQRKRYGSVQWEHTKAVVMPRDGWTCQVLRGEVGRTPAEQICGRRANVCDHIVRPEEWDPPNHPDADRPGNCRAACRSCNMVRHGARYFREKVDAAAGAQAPVLASVRAGPAIDPDGIEVQKRLPLIDRPHDHVDAYGLDRHTGLYTGGAMFRVCPRDCPDRSRLLVPK